MVYSEGLNRQEIFIDFPWVYIDHLANQHKYIFRRDGKLILSLNGKVVEGSWEYLNNANSLLINRGQDMILLNQVFIERGVMVLKQDGIADLMILGNELVIPDNNVLNYLRNLLYSKENITLEMLKDGRELEVYNYNTFTRRVTIEGCDVRDSEVELNNGEIWELNHSEVVCVRKDRKYQTDVGNIIVREKNGLGPSEGDLVFQNNKLAKDGTYRFGILDRIVVKDGRIIKYKLFW